MRRIAVLDAPSNLGLRPPTATSVPGCAKAPGALRDQGLLTRLAARDAGCLTPPRYDPGDWRPGDGVAHAPEIAAYSRALADRIGAILDNGEFPVVLGGDCSILIGSGIAMHRLGDAVGGRIGLVFVDGHSDFRHPGNASYVGAAAGEDLALVTGRGQADLAAIESRRPYFRDIDVVVLGIRAQDEYRLDLQAAGIVTRPVPALRAEGAARSAQWARDQLVDCAGYWVHVDVDVLDPAVMPAVDAPDPGGIAFPELEILLAGLVESPHCLGVEITVFDPDYDPDGRYAAEITSAIVSGLSPVRATAARPDLVAARRDLANPAAAPSGAAAPSADVAASGDGPAEAVALAGDTPDPAAPAAGPSGEIPAAVGASDGGGLADRLSDENPEETAGPVAVVSSSPEGDPASAVLGPLGEEAVESPDDAVEADDVDHADAATVDADPSRNDQLGEASADPNRNGRAGEASADRNSQLSEASADPNGSGRAREASADRNGNGWAGEAPADPDRTVHATDVEFVLAAALGTERGGNGLRPRGIDVRDRDGSDDVRTPSEITGSDASVDDDPENDETAHAGVEHSGPDPEKSDLDESDLSADPGDAEPEVHEPGRHERGNHEPDGHERGDHEPDGNKRGDDELDGKQRGDHEPDGHEAEPDEALEPVAAAEDEPAPDQERVGRPGVSREGNEVRLLSRPLGSAPLLDSEPLPATRPGMLRPRPPADPPVVGGFGPPAAGPGVLGGLPPGVS